LLGQRKQRGRCITLTAQFDVSLLWALLSSLCAATRRAGCVVLRNLLSGSSCRLHATGKIGEFTRDSSLLQKFRTSLVKACSAGIRRGVGSSKTKSARRTVA